MSAIINATNVVWGKSNMFLTRSGGVADDLPCGELQNVEISVQQALEELMGPSQLTAIGVGVKEVKVTGSAEWAKIRSRQFYAFRGGSAPTTASSKTTYNFGVNDEPVTFNIHLKSPSDGSDMEVKIWGCIATTVEWKLQNGNFVIPKFQFNAYGDGTNIMQLILPGDQTTS